MSYARFGWEGSDVYVYLDVGGYLACCGCCLSDYWRHDDTASMIAHLREHQAAGHHVPEETIAELEADRVANDAWIREGRA